MSNAADRILAHLHAVEVERLQRQNEPGLTHKVSILKAWQQARFAITHADVLQSSRFGPAARFFLNDLYGPQDFADRDAQFARIVPALVRLFPSEVVAAVDALAELHALSEQLDSRMGRQLASSALDAKAYANAWRATGDPASRALQLALALDLGHRLDDLTRNRLLRQSLRLMRGPAKAAGLSALQGFLERGFDAFATMKGADDFLALIEQRERALMRTLFEAPLSPP